MTSSEYERKFQRFFMNKSQQSIKKFHQFLGLTFATHLLWFHLIMDRVQCERCCQIAAIYFTWHCLIKSTHSQTIATETMKNSANIFSLFYVCCASLISFSIANGVESKCCRMQSFFFAPLTLLSCQFTILIS